MANRERGEVDGTLGGRALTFVVDTNAMCEIEGLLSKPEKECSYRLDVMPQIGRLSSTAVRAFLWGATRRYHRDLTVAQIADLIDESGGIIPLFPLIRQIAGLAEPTTEDVEATKTDGGKRPRKAQAGAGGTSSSRPVASA